MGSVRDELKADMGSVRDELKADMGLFRVEFKADMAGARGDLAKAILAVKYELEKKIDALTNILLRTRSDLFEAYERAVFKAEQVHRDQTITHYRLDDLDGRVKVLEVARKRRRSA